jgi:hypothetical protein
VLDNRARCSVIDVTSSHCNRAYVRSAPLCTVLPTSRVNAVATLLDCSTMRACSNAHTTGTGIGSPTMRVKYTRTHAHTLTACAQSEQHRRHQSHHTRTARCELCKRRRARARATSDAVRVDAHARPTPPQQRQHSVGSARVRELSSARTHVTIHVSPNSHHAPASGCVARAALRGQQHTHRADL